MEKRQRAFEHSGEPPISVLLIDDDRSFASLVCEYLTADGAFKVSLAYDGRSGVEKGLDRETHIIVLDVGLPAMNGFEVLKSLREKTSTPIIMLTARGDDIDRILGLELGADDYVPKPCNLRDLAARIKAVARRLDRHRSDQSIQFGDLSLEPATQTVRRQNELIPITGSEFLVLESLLKQPGQVVDKNTISEHALGRRWFPYDRSIDVHIGNIRKKLGPLADGRQRIKAVRGRGYLFLAEQ